MECEICGNQIFGQGLNKVIDGARLIVCFDCAKFSGLSPQRFVGERAQEKKPTTAPRIRRETVRREAISIRDDLELTENYGSLVRKARDNMRLTHDELSRQSGVKVSVLQKLETGKMIPDRALAKRLERTLKIKLLRPTSKISFEEKFTIKPSKLTLGDVIYRKNKEYDETGEEQ